MDARTLRACVEGTSGFSRFFRISLSIEHGGPCLPRFFDGLFSCGATIGRRGATFGRAAVPKRVESASQP